MIWLHQLKKPQAGQMNRIALACLISAVASTSVFAIELFNKHWKEHYLSDNSNASFVKVAQHTGCHVCHVKGEKKEIKNEYGRALAQYLDAKEFAKEWVDANPEQAKRRIIEAFQKVEEELSVDDRNFGEKIRAGELPATDDGV